MRGQVVTDPTHKIPYNPLAHYIIPVHTYLIFCKAYLVEPRDHLTLVPLEDSLVAAGNGVGVAPVLAGRGAARVAGSEGPLVRAARPGPLRNQVEIARMADDLAPLTADRLVRRYILANR